MLQSYQQMRETFQEVYDRATAAREQCEHDYRLAKAEIEASNDAFDELDEYLYQANKVRGSVDEITVQLKQAEERCETAKQACAVAERKLLLAKKECQELLDAQKQINKKYDILSEQQPQGEVWYQTWMKFSS